jgi:cytochrome c5
MTPPLQKCLSMAMTQALPDGEGKKLLEERCASCHDLKPVVSLKQSQGAWKELLVKMRGYGAQLDDKEVDVATDYLTKHFGPESSAAAAHKESPEEKTAKRLIEGICSSCHDAGSIRSTEATKKQWFDIVANAALDQTSRHQTLLAEGFGDLFVQSVEFFRGGRLAVDVHRFRRAALHPVCEFVGGDTCRQLRTAGIARGVHLVQVVQHIEPAALLPQ